VPAILRSPVWTDRRFQPPPHGVEVDDAHPLSVGLRWVVAGSHQEVATRQPPVQVGPNTQILQDRGGRTWSNTSLSQVATVGWPFPSRMASDSGRQCTLVVLGALGFGMGGAPSDSGGVVVISYRATGWTSPWISLQFGRPFNTDRIAQFHYASAGTSVGVTTTGVFWLINEWHSYVVVRNSGVVTFYRDGATIETVTLATDTDVDWGERRPIELMGKNFGASNATDGSIAMAAIWMRALSSAEILQIYAEPYAFLRPVIRRRWFVPPAGAVPVSASASPPWEAVARVSPTSRVGPWEAVARVAPVGRSAPWESLARVTPQSRVSPWEALTTTSAARTGPWEGLARTSSGRGVAWEGLGRIVRPGSVAWESIQPVSRSLTSVWEGLSRVAKTAVGAWESGGLVGVLRSIPWEAAGQGILRRLRALLWVGE
jgi:hypothetical protein